MARPCCLIRYPIDRGKYMMNLRELPSAAGNEEQHYLNLNAYQRGGFNAALMHGAFWRIDASTYEYFESMLPPVYIPMGFRMCEMLTDDIASCFFKVGDEYWCGYANVRKSTETYSALYREIWRAYDAAKEGK